MFGNGGDLVILIHVLLGGDGEQVGVERGDPVEAPLGVDDGEEDIFLFFGDGIPGSVQLAIEFVVGRGFAGLQEKVFAGEVMFDRIVADAIFSFRRFGARGVLRVLPIDLGAGGIELRERRHICRLHSSGQVFGLASGTSVSR